MWIMWMCCVENLYPLTSREEFCSREKHVFRKNSRHPVRQCLKQTDKLTGFYFTTSCYWLEVYFVNCFHNNVWISYRRLVSKNNGIKFLQNFCIVICCWLVIKVNFHKLIFALCWPYLLNIFRIKSSTILVVSFYFLNGN